MSVKQTVTNRDQSTSDTQKYFDKRKEGSEARIKATDIIATRQTREVNTRMKETAFKEL